MSDSMPDKAPNIDEETELYQQTHEMDASVGRGLSPTENRGEPESESVRTASHSPKYRLITRIIECFLPHPATQNTQGEDEATTDESLRSPFTPFQAGYSQAPQEFAGQGLYRSPASLQQGMNRPWADAPSNWSSHENSSPSQTVDSERSVASASTPYRVPASPSRTGAGPSSSQSETETRGGRGQSRQLGPAGNQTRRPWQPYVSSREPDGRRWSSRIESPGEFEMPLDLMEPRFSHANRRRNNYLTGTHVGVGDWGGMPPNAVPMYLPQQPQQGVMAQSSSQTPERGMQGLGIFNYLPSPQRNHSDGSSRRPSVHDMGNSEGNPESVEISPHRPVAEYPQVDSGQFTQLEPAQSGWTENIFPMPLRESPIPERSGPESRVMSPEPPGDLDQMDIPPGGYYWCVTTAHQHKRTESRSTQQLHKEETMREEQTVPIKLCEPPLANSVPPNPAALAADPPPKNKRKSKYSEAQDKVILELKNVGFPWDEIADKAKCGETLATRNRYQVLIGQQGSGTYAWAHSDIRHLQGYLDEAEMEKWRFIARELSRRRNKSFTPEMCHFKVSKEFRENPAKFGVLKSLDPSKGGKPHKREEYESKLSTDPPNDSQLQRGDQSSPEPPEPDDDLV